MYWKFYNLFKIDWENPLKIWEKYGRRFFIRPKMKFRFWKKYHGVDPMNILEIYGVGLGWKSKYGVLEYEEDPYIEITLFKHISLHIDFLAPKYNEKNDGEVFDVCYWEGILSMMNNVNSITGELKKPEEDALYDSYVENQWFDCCNKENDEYQAQKTIKPFLKPLGKLILDIKIREAQVKEVRENGTLNHNHW